MTKSRSEQIFDHALRYVTPFRTSLGHSWAIIPDGPGRYHGLSVTSRGFRQWLAHSFHYEYSLFPGAGAVGAAVDMLEAKARHSEFPVSDIFTRVGWRGDRRMPQSVLLHLANANNEVIEITPGGHRIVNAESWHFLAGASTEPLPRPIASTVTLIDHLRSLLHLDGPALERIVIWLFAALRPLGPYPVLFITGSPGSGKSTLATTLRSLIDPSTAPLLAPPATEHDLLTLALHNHVLAFDHVSFLPRRIGESVARLATGTGIGICGRNIFDAPQPLPLARPVIVTAPTDRRAFTQNAIHVELEAIESAGILTEKNFAKQLQAAGPGILGTLCAAVASALANIAPAAVTSVSRFADVHEWTVAAAPVLGLTPEQINRALAATPLVSAIGALLENQPEWTGTATELHEKLLALGLPDAASDPRHLSQQLNSLPLALFGIELDRGRSNTERLIHLRTQTPEFSVTKRESETTTPSGSGV